MGKYILVKEEDFHKFVEGKMEVNEIEKHQIDGQKAANLIYDRAKEDIQIVKASFGF